MHYTVGIVDDHQLFTGSLEMMLNSFRNFIVNLTARNGTELQEKIQAMEDIPDIILIDVSLPDMSGVEVATWLTENFPATKLAALTMTDASKNAYAMIKAGCCSYMLKNIHPTELEKGMLEIAVKGYYNAEGSNIDFRKLLEAGQGYALVTERESEFLKLAAGGFTYKQIADSMGVAKRTVDGYRENLFRKLDVANRTEMIMEAVKRGWVEL